MYKLGLIRSRKDIRDYKFERYAAFVFPDKLDLRDNMLKVKDQGYQGSCSAMTASQMKEWQENVPEAVNEVMSAQYVYNLRSNFPEEGMQPRDTMKIICENGIVEERFYPYGTNQNTGDIKPSILERGKLYRSKSYAAISSINGLKQSLYENGPCYLGIPVYNYSERMWKQNPGESLLGGHAVTIVGYNDEGFIIRNSWGTSWGDNGHCIFPYEDWGSQWECWTATDYDIEPPKLSFCQKILIRIWNFLINLF